MSQVEFEKQKGFLGFVTKFDRYADPINLSYNHQKVYKTSHGGILTMISFFAIIYFFANNFYAIIMKEFTSTTTLGSLTEDREDTNAHLIDGFVVARDQLIVAHQLVTVNHTVLPQDQIRDYFDAVYIQTNNTSQENITTYYNSTPCQNMPDINDQFQKVDYLSYYCPNMPQNSSIELAGFTGYIGNNTARYKLMIGTCASLAKYTGKTTCASHEQSVEYADYVYLDVNIWTTYFDPEFYIDNNGLQYVNSFFRNALSSELVQSREFSMRKQEIFFSQSWSFSFFNKQILGAVQMIDQNFNFGSQSQVDAQSDFDQFFVKYTFSPNLLVEKSHYIRTNLMLIFTTIGSFMYTVKNLGNAANRNVNKFQVDNAMITRLYSTDRRVEGHMNDIVEDQDEMKTGRQELIDSLDTRERWIYGWRDTCCPPKGSGCSCRCFPCKKTTLKDKLFAKGRKKLYDEIDILRIVKQLRILSFATDLILTPGQKSLVRWFDKYKLGINSDDDDESQRTDSDAGDKKVKSNKNLPSVDDIEEDQLSSFDQLLKSASQANKKRRESYYEEHHLFVTDDLRDQAKEALEQFDCSQHIIDQLLLARVQGYEDMRTVMAQLGLIHGDQEQNAPRLSGAGIVGKLLQSRDEVNLLYQKDQNVPKTLDVSQRRSSAFKIVRRKEARPLQWELCKKTQNVVSQLKKLATKKEKRNDPLQEDKAKARKSKRSNSVEKTIKEIEEDDSFEI